jgi:hypothetical protein
MADARDAPAQQAVDAQARAWRMLVDTADQAV